MKKRFHILRKEIKGTPYWEDYIYETQDEGVTVAAAISALGEANLAKRQAGDYRPIAWEHSCLQKRCGACAMVINGKPALACDTKLSDISGETVTLEPLKKFPVVEDLLVDRTVMMETLKTLSVWLDDNADEGGEDMAFDASCCLQCGLCLEVCPNFAPYGKFAGMAGMAPLARLIAQLPKEQRRRVSKDYTRHVFEGCGKSLACRDICPAKINIEDLMVKSNAAAVWRRWNKKS